jgi:hypothetical protein
MVIILKQRFREDSKSLDLGITDSDPITVEGPQYHLRDMSPGYCLFLETADKHDYFKYWYSQIHRDQRAEKHRAHASPVGSVFGIS